jgi:cell division protein FtsZ
VNVDFADIKAIMQNAGSALMGIGRGSGETRAVDAARAAIESPMLDVTIDGAKGIVFNITSGPDLRMYEVEEAARIITEHADPNAKIIFGVVEDADYVEPGELKITVVATGFDKQEPVRQPKQRYGGATPYQARPSYSPFAPQAQPQPQPEPMQAAPLEPRSVFTPQPRYVGPTGQTAKPQDEAEDLEVPTFIRRKMREQKEARRQGKDLPE